jgi:protein-S-isoprenylcysteine O-methyltransferase Ste14
MHSFLKRIRKTWFEIRIFISLSVVVIVTAVSFLVFAGRPSIIELAGSIAGLPGSISIRYGYYLIAFLVVVASLIRMWAGSILTSRTVMSFEIQDKTFKVEGPYKYVRNPIYYADLIAFTSLSLCLRPVGLLIPVLIFLHYTQLISYEEEKLKTEFGNSYTGYLKTTPALLPGIKGYRHFIKDKGVFRISWDGFRHNAQYILFVPGLVVASFTGKFLHALIIGLPAIIDWAVVHTIIGLNPDKKKVKQQAE